MQAAWFNRGFPFWVWDLMSFNTKRKLIAPLRIRAVPGTQRIRLDCLLLSFYATICKPNTKHNSSIYNIIYHVHAFCSS